MYPEDVEALLTEQQITRRVDELAQQLLEKYHDKNPMFVGILGSCYVFMADVIRRFAAPCTVEFLAVSHYGPDHEGVVLAKDVGMAPMGRHVVVLEALLDTGRTMTFVTNLLQHRGAASLEVCTLLDQPSHRQVPIEADYVGFSIPACIPVGYGLDNQDRFRNLPYIGAYHPETEQTHGTEVSN